MNVSPLIKKTAISNQKSTLKGITLLLCAVAVVGWSGKALAHSSYGPQYDCAQCHEDGRTWESIHGAGGNGYDGIQTPPLAQLAGTIHPGKAAYPGGALYYQYALQTLKAGKAVVKYGIKATPSGAVSWKPTAPASISTNVALGTTPLASPAISIPAGFIGNVTLTMSIVFTSKDGIVKNVSVNPVVVPISPQQNFYDVGFGNQVTLDASGIATGLGTNVSYTWTKKTNSAGILTPGGSLSATNAKVVILTTGLSELVDTNGQPGIIGFQNEQVEASTYVYEVKAIGTIKNGKNASTITRAGTFTISCAEQSPATSRMPQLIGTNGSTTNAGSYFGYLGTNGSRTAVGVNACYLGTNWAFVSWPSNSITASNLTHSNEGLTQFRPDVAGVYVLTNTYTYTTTNSSNVVTTNRIRQCITNTAASYVGSDACYACHGQWNPYGNKDVFTTWWGTAHASMAQRGIDGDIPGYNETCFKCHTLGYNASTNAAANGNFKAVANKLGWKFPTTLRVGNFDAMPAQLQQLASIQCESCHGPGTHKLGVGAPSKSLDIQICATCHQDGANYSTITQWENNPHNEGYNTISAGGRGTTVSCARCHSPNGFTYVSKTINDQIAAGISAAAAQTNVGAVNVPTNQVGVGPLTCQTCHDPHDSFDDDSRHQLRVFDTVVIGDLTKSNTVTLTNVGKSAACMICHNSRRLAEQPATTNAGSLKYYQNSLSGTHDSPVAEVFSGNGEASCTNTNVTSYTGYIYYTNGTYATNGNYNQAKGNSAHASVADCTTCHMYQLRDVNAKGVPQDVVSINGTNKPVTHELYIALRDLVGGHTFRMANNYVTNGATYEVMNVAACNQCHKDQKGNGVSNLDLGSHYNSISHVVINARDYDGDGTNNGIQTETQGLLDRIRLLLNATGISTTTNATTGDLGFATNATNGYSGLASTNNMNLRTAQQKAAWNFMMINRDKSMGVHNSQFAIRVLQSSWTDLNTAWATNSNTNNGKTFHQVYTNAALR